MSFKQNSQQCDSFKEIKDGNDVYLVYFILLAGAYLFIIRKIFDVRCLKEIHI